MGPHWGICHHLTQSLQQSFAQQEHRPKHRQNPKHHTSIEPETIRQQQVNFTHLLQMVPVYFWVLLKGLF